MKYERRKFIESSLKGTTFLSTYSMLPFSVFPPNDRVGFKIDTIEIFRYNSNSPRYFSWGTWYNRQQVFMKMTSGNHIGWSETNGSTNNPDLDLETWGEFLKPLKGMDIYAAYDLIKENQKSTGKFSVPQLEFIEMNLLGLIGRIAGKPAVELLGLTEKGAVPGFFCILNNDLEEIEQNIHKAIDQGLATHVKFKMYGKPDFDLKIAKLARSLLRKDAFILSDVNKGYKEWQNLDELAGILVKLRGAGLNACEDPAELTNEQWIA